jgi:hypothetical protein
MILMIKKALINGVLRGLRPLSGAWGRAPQGLNQRFLKSRCGLLCDVSFPVMFPAIKQ